MSESPVNFETSVLPSIKKCVRQLSPNGQIITENQIEISAESITKCYEYYQKVNGDK